MHYIVEGRFRQAVERYLKQETEAIAQKQTILFESSQLKKEKPLGSR